MALFQKKPQTSSSAPFYTLGLTKTVLIVGLGNPGNEHTKTRHNLGFICIDAFAQSQEFPSWTDKKDLKCQITQHNLGDVRVILMKPTTYMNNSGEAVQAIQQFYKISNNQTVVVHDELDIEFGQIRTRIGGSDAGNNGIKSILQHVGEDFARVRIGIGPKHPPEMDSADFVLQKISSTEKKHFNNLMREVESILVEFVYNGKLAHETRGFLF